MRLLYQRRPEPGAPKVSPTLPSLKPPAQLRITPDDSGQAWQAEAESATYEAEGVDATTPTPSACRFRPVVLYVSPIGSTLQVSRRGRPAWLYIPGTGTPGGPNL